MSDELSGQKKGKGRQALPVILLVICVAVIIALVVIIILIVNRKEEEEPRRNVVVNKENAEQVIDEMLQQEYVPQGYYSVVMTNIWHFASGGAISEDAVVQNVLENTHDVYFDIFLADNEDEAIYQSPVLPRGSELDNIALDIELSAGTYDCVMIYHLVDEEQKTVSTLRVGLTIVVGQ